MAELSSVTASSEVDRELRDVDRLDGPLVILYYIGAYDITI